MCFDGHWWTSSRQDLGGSHNFFSYFMVLHKVYLDIIIHYFRVHRLSCILLGCNQCPRVILLETVTLHDQLSLCVSVCHVSIPSSSIQHPSTILNCHIFISFWLFWQHFWGFTVFLFSKANYTKFIFLKQVSPFITITGSMTVQWSFYYIFLFWW